MVGHRIKVGWPAHRDRACWEPPEHRRGEPEESTEHAGNRLDRETVTRTSGKTTARARTVVGSRGCRPGKVQGQSAESGSGGNHEVQMQWAPWMQEVCSCVCTETCVCKLASYCNNIEQVSHCAKSACACVCCAQYFATHVVSLLRVLVCHRCRCHWPPRAGLTDHTC
jgi:hypothetical protein